MRAVPASVEQYLAEVHPPAARASLEHLRAVIRKAAPDADEVISYGIPTFKDHGMLASYAAFKNHCSFFPGSVVSQFEDKLKGYKLAKGTIQFPHDKPLPDALVTEIVKARVKQNRAGKAAK